MLTQAILAGAVLLAGLSGLVAANITHDLGVPRPLSRGMASIAGGAAFLIAVLTLHAWVAVALRGALTLLVRALRWRFRGGLRGVEGRLPAQGWAELTYPLAGTASLAAGWAWLGDRWLAFVPIAYMAWGDSVAGLARASIEDMRAWRLWPSAAMLAVTLLVALMFHPYWIGALGAVLATAAECFRPIKHALWDDNWVIVAGSLAVMAVLSRAAV